MKNLSILAFLSLTLIPLNNVFGQFEKITTLDDHSSMVLKEFNAILTEISDSGVHVKMIIGNGNVKSSTSETLQKDDLILMINGKKIKDITGLRKKYESISDNEVIKIGVRRGEERFILTRSKGDVPDGSFHQAIRMDLDMFETPIIIPQLGVIVSDKNDQIIVKAPIPQLVPEEMKSFDLTGYQLQTINGKTFDLAYDVTEFLNTLTVGDIIDLVIEKNGVQKTFSFPMPDIKGSFNISTKMIDNE